MTNDDFKSLKQHLLLPPHTPLSTQIELLKSDMTRLLGEVMRLRSALHEANQAQVALLAEMQREIDLSHASGANALRAAALEVTCTECSEELLRLTAERTFQ